MYLILLFLLIFIRMESDCSDQIDSHLVSYHYHSVNVITGEYCEAETDGFLNGPLPLQIRRSYHSNDELGRWDFNFPNLFQHQAFEFDGHLLPQGTIQYQYDKERRLCEVETTNISGTKTFNRLRIEYPSRGKQECKLETDTGENYLYRYRSAGIKPNYPPYLLEEVITPQGSCRYSYQAEKNGVQRMIKRELPEGRVLVNEYDPANGKVLRQFAPIGRDEQLTVQHRFVYHNGSTELYDAMNHKTLYRFEEDHLTAIEHYGEGNAKSVKTERFYWRKEKANSKLIARTIVDENGKIVVCRAFKYDEDGNLTEEKICGNLTGRCSAPICISDAGELLENGMESYFTTYQYSKKTPHHIQSKTEANGTVTRYLYDEKTGLNSAKLIEKNEAIQMRHFTNYNQDHAVVRTVIDDGDTVDPDNLNGVTERVIKEYLLRDEKPGIGLPEQVIEKHWDSNSQQERVTKTITNHYSAKGQLIQQHQMSDDKENHTTYCYDSAGRVASITNEQEQSHTEYQYDANGNKIYEKSSRTDHSEEQVFQYDYANRLISHQKGDEKITYCYDLSGNKLSQIDSSGNLTAYQYDSMGREIQVTFPSVLDEEDHPVQYSETKQYNALDQLVEQSNCNGEITRTVYNVRGKPIKKIYPDGTTECFEYHLDGTLYQFISREGIRSVYTTDFLGRVTKTECYDNAGQYNSKAEAAYTAFRLLNQTDCYGDQIEKQKTKRSDRSLKNKALETAPINNPYYLNDRGQCVLQTSYTDPAGATTITTFDAMQRAEVIVKTDPFGREVARQTMRYDGLGNKVKETHTTINAEGLQVGSFTTKWSYGSHGKIEAVLEAFDSPLQATTHYCYNHFGQLETVIKPDGVKLVYIYDAMGRVAQFSSSDRSISYQYGYDLNHKMTKVDDLINGCSTHYQYDSKGRLVFEQLGNGLIIQREFDQDNRLEKLLLPNEVAIQYSYSEGKLIQIDRLNREEEVLYSHRYTKFNQKGVPIACECIKNLGEQTFHYNEEGDLIEIDSRFRNEKIITADLMKQPLHKKCTDIYGSNETHYQYDYRQQVSAESGTFNQRFLYDSLFNRTQEGSINEGTIASEVNARNQLLTYGTMQCSYDSNGCLIEKISEDKQTYYTYDALNRLLEVRENGLHIQYNYDHTGRRIFKLSKQADGSLIKSNFIYDGENEIGSTDASGIIKELRVLGSGPGAEIAATVAMELNEKIYLPIHDLRGSITSLIDSETAQPAAVYRYSAFGEFQSLGDQPDLSPWLFFGKRYEKETQLYFFGQRYYNPQWGRWVTPDPLGFADGPNRYAFVLNNPVTLHDLYGLLSAADLWNNFTKQVSQFFNHLFGVGDRIKAYANGDFSFANYAHAEIDYAAHQLCSEIYLIMAGYYEGGNSVGVFGDKEISNKFRITAINGILNLDETWCQSLDWISQAHGGTKIHYVLHHTEGWTWDLIKGVLSKLGYHSTAVGLVAQTWREMIAELGGIDSGGKIIHYAHSLGGTNTLLARDLLSPQEQKMIKVIAIGSCSIIPNEGFYSAINYVSYRDIILFASPIDYFKALIMPSNVVFLGSPLGIPLIDHLLSMETYRRLLEMLGKEFVDGLEREQENL